MNNGLHLRGRHGAARIGGQHHRSFGRCSVPHKHALLGRGQVHTGALHTANLHDRSRQFLFHGGVHLDLLHELAGGHGRLVFQPVQARGPGLGQALRGQKNTRLMKALAGYRELACDRIDFGMKLARFERVERRLLVSLLQPRHDRAVRRALHPRIGQAKNHQHHQHQNEGQHAAHRRLLDDFDESVRHAQGLPSAQTPAGGGACAFPRGRGQGHAASRGGHLSLRVGRRHQARVH